MTLVKIKVKKVGDVKSLRRCLLDVMESMDCGFYEEDFEEWFNFFEEKDCGRMKGEDLKAAEKYLETHEEATVPEFLVEHLVQKGTWNECLDFLKYVEQDLIGCCGEFEWDYITNKKGDIAYIVGSYEEYGKEEW